MRDLDAQLCAFELSAVLFFTDKIVGPSWSCPATSLSVVKESVLRSHHIFDTFTARFDKH